MSKYIQGKYKSRGSASQYGNLINLVDRLSHIKELEYQDIELTHTELEIIDNKVNELTEEIHTWWGTL